MVLLEMTLSRAEFDRCLPAAVDGPIVQDGDVLRGGEGARTWEIRVTALPPLALGALALERLRVEVAFEGFAAAEEAAFMDRFRAHTQRGGG